MNDAIVTFNVGGTKFQTLSSTIQKAPTSRLAKLLNQTQRSSGNESDDANIAVNTDSDGAIFIDRSPHLFSHILDFLRNDKNVRKCTSLPSQDTPDGARLRYDLMKEMFEHYDMADAAIAIAPRTFLFDPSHTSPGLDISRSCLTAVVNQGQVNQWNSVRCAIPLLTDDAMFSSVNSMLAQKLNRFTVCIDRDISVMTGLQNKDNDMSLMPPPALPVISDSASSSKKKNKRHSTSISMSPLSKQSSQGRLQTLTGSQGQIRKGTVLQFTSAERLQYQPCKLQLGVVSAAYQCVPINQPLIPEGKQYETLQPHKTPHLYACPVNGSLKASETFSVWFDVKVSSSTSE